MTSMNVTLHNIRLDVMLHLEKQIGGFVDKFLTPIEKIWQPSDFLPNSQHPNFIDEIKEIQELGKELEDDFWAVLVGDAVTEEALPTYESWLMQVEGVKQSNELAEDNSWAKWIRQWTAEENRHGDVLNKYMYLSGRVNMREVEISTQHLITDGFDLGTARDPYKNFVYTSFQELATYVSHNNLGDIARKKGHKLLSRMSKMIAGDEMRHHLAYSEFVKHIFEWDPSEMMKAFQYMMKLKITMPAVNMRESSGVQGHAFDQFSISAQRLGVYTSSDYVEILRKLNKMWDIENIRGLNEDAEKARDWLLKLPERMQRVTDRIAIPKTTYQYKWLIPA